jgi:drug/metabolite transporter (DMT)-like permease
MVALTHDSSRTASGLGLAVASAASFALSGPFARGLLEAGWTPAAAVAVRVLVAALVLVPVAVVALQGRWGRLRAGTPASGRRLRLVPVAGTQLAYFTAVGYMEVGAALLVEYTAPVLVLGWLWARHGQRPTGLTIAGAVTAIAGLVLVLDLLSGADISVVGIVWALAATSARPPTSCCRPTSRTACPASSWPREGCSSAGSRCSSPGRWASSR